MVHIREVVYEAHVVRIHGTHFYSQQQQQRQRQFRIKISRKHNSRYCMEGF